MSDSERDTSQDAFRGRALTGLAIAVVLAVGGWLFLSRATDAGIARLARIDTVRAMCDAQMREARTTADTVRVDAIALPDTIDPRSASALKRCSDLRAMTSKTLPSGREMTGEPMPRGLR